MGIERRACARAAGVTEATCMCIEEPS